MKFLLLLFGLAVLFACNHPEGNAVPSGDRQQWDSTSRYQFLNACIEEQQARISDTLAYAYCNCMLEQLELRYNHPDSISVIDSITMRTMQQNCVQN